MSHFGDFTFEETNFFTLILTYFHQLNITANLKKWHHSLQNKIKISFKIKGFFFFVVLTQCSSSFRYNNIDLLNDLLVHDSSQFEDI